MITSSPEISQVSNGKDMVNIGIKNWVYQSAWTNIYWSDHEAVDESPVFVYSIDTLPSISSTFYGSNLVQRAVNLLLDTLSIFLYLSNRFFSLFYFCFALSLSLFTSFPLRCCDVASSSIHRIATATSSSSASIFSPSSSLPLLSISLWSGRTTPSTDTLIHTRII